MEKIFEEEFRRRREVTNELNGFGYEKKYEDIYNEFFKETGDGFFETKKDILVLAAIIGFHLYSKQSNKIENYKLEKNNFKLLSPVDFTEYYHLIYSVALSLNNDIKDVLNNSRIVEIFNKCAGLGIIKLKEILTKDSDGYIRNFEDFLEQPEEFLEVMYDRDKEINEIMGIIS